MRDKILEAMSVQAKKYKVAGDSFTHAVDKDVEESPEEYEHAGPSKDTKAKYHRAIAARGQVPQSQERRAKREKLNKEGKGGAKILLKKLAWGAAKTGWEGPPSFGKNSWLYKPREK